MPPAGGRVGARAGGAVRALHLLRHGCTEMNEYLAQHPWDAPGFQDPLMYDTRLTAGGLAQARRARERVQGLTQCPFPPGVIVVSPLTRALRTMEEAFADVLATGEVPVVVTPLASERVYHGSDVGALRSELEAEFPRYDFSELPAGPWWYGGGGGSGGGCGAGGGGGGGGGAGGGGRKFQKEPGAEFLERMAKFRAFLQARPERHIAYVGHWAVLYALTGIDFDNCELVSTNLDALAEPEELDPDFL